MSFEKGNKIIKMSLKIDNDGHYYIPKLESDFNDITKFFNENIEIYIKNNLRIVIDFYNFDQQLIDKFLNKIKNYYTFIRPNNDFKKYIFYPVPLVIDITV